MNMEHLKAIVPIGQSRSLTHNGVDLWSNGHLIVPASFPGSIETLGIGKTWDENAAREEVSLEVGAVLEDFDGVIYREMKCAEFRVVLDEAYRVTIQDSADIDAYGVDPRKPVTFRVKGVMVGVLMGIRPGEYDVSEDQSPTEEAVFSRIARRSNDWYLQGVESLRKLLRSATEDEDDE